MHMYVFLKGSEDVIATLVCHLSGIDLMAKRIYVSCFLCAHMTALFVQGN